MKKNKLPAYQHYPKDMLTDEAYLLMTWEERGVYRHLLDIQWLEGSIPGDLQILARLLGMEMSHFETIWKLVGTKFILDEKQNRFVNFRLAKSRKDYKKYSKKMSEAGKVGANARWGKEKQQNGYDGNRMTTACDSQCDRKEIALAKNSSSSSSSIASSSNKEKELEEKESQPPPNPPRGEILVEEIIELYHQILPDHPKVLFRNKPARKYIQARFKEDKKRRSIRWWKGFFRRVSKTPFLCGGLSWTDGRKYGLTWLVRPKNFGKVLDKEYQGLKEHKEQRSRLETVGRSRSDCAMEKTKAPCNRCAGEGIVKIKNRQDMPILGCICLNKPSGMKSYLEVIIDGSISLEDVIFASPPNKDPPSGIQQKQINGHVQSVVDNIFREAQRGDE